MPKRFLLFTLPVLLINAPSAWAALDGEPPQEFLPFLFAAYTAFWVLLFLYIQILSRRNRRMEKEIDELREVVARRGQ